MKEIETDFQEVQTADEELGNAKVYQEPPALASRRQSSRLASFESDFKS